MSYLIAEPAVGTQVCGCGPWVHPVPPGADPLSARAVGTARTVDNESCRHAHGVRYVYLEGPSCTFGGRRAAVVRVAGAFIMVHGPYGTGPVVLVDAARAASGSRDVARWVLTTAAAWKYS